MTRVLVTGATGFIGKALCQLLEENAFDVTRAVRKPTGQGKEFVISDLSPETDWTVALENVDFIVHLAARVHVMDDMAQDPLAVFRSVNRDATQNLAEQAAAAGVKRFIYLSSIKATGETSGDAPLVEGTKTLAQDDPYGQSKLEAEQTLQKIAENSDMTVCVIRPPLVYGPGVKGNFLALLKVVRRRLPLPLGSIKNRRSLVYLGNLIHAILASLVTEISGFKVYHISDGPPVSTPSLIKAIGKAFGTPPLLLPVPASWLLFLGASVGKKKAISRLVGSLEVDSRLIERELNWKPSYSLDEGLAETIRWFKSENP